MVLGVLEVLVDTRGDDRANLGDASAPRATSPEPLQRLDLLGDDLGHPRADVADRQAGEQAVERPASCWPRRLTRFSADFFPIRSRSASVAASSR